MKADEYSSGMKSFIPCGIFLLLISSCQPESSEAPTKEIVSSQVSGDSDMGFVPIDILVDAGDFFLTDVHAGLDQLESYTSSVDVSFSGTVDGESQEWSQTFKLFHTAQPIATQLIISPMTAGMVNPPNNGDPDLAIPMFIADLGEVHYEMTEEGKCRAEAIFPEMIDNFSQISLYEPASMLKPVFGAEEVGQEITNGVTAKHYTFDQRALLADAIAQASGELWTAVDTGILLRYLLTVTGGSDYFGEGIEGTMTWDYFVSDIDTTLQPEFPKGCQLEVPLMPDASQIRHLPYWLNFSTQSTSDSAVSFYQQQLSALGWVQTIGPMVTEDSTFMEYTRNDQTIGVYISATTNGLEVNVILYQPNKPHTDN